MGATLTSIADGIVEVDREENKLQQATAHLDILDEIQDIDEIESDQGKAKLERQIAKLKRLGGGDDEDGSA